MADFVGPDASMPILRSRVHGEQADRFQLLGDGTILKGDGRGSLAAEGVSVKAFGAKGDGSSNDGAAIQRAIDEAAASVASFGDKATADVFLPAGYYKSDPLVLPGNVHLRGNGARITARGSGPLITINGAYNRISQLFIQGGGSAVGSSGVAFASGSRWSSIDFCRFDQFAGKAIDIQAGSVAHWISKVYAQNCLLNRGALSDFTGVLSVDGTDHWIEQCEITASLQALSSSNLFVAAISVRNRNHFISNCVGEIADVGFYLGSDAALTRFVNCRADLNFGDGWRIAGGGGSIVGCHAINNSQHGDNTYDGFNLTAAANFQFNGCVAESTVPKRHRFGFWDQGNSFSNYCTYTGCRSRGHAGGQGFFTNGFAGGVISLPDNPPVAITAGVTTTNVDQVRNLFFQSTTPVTFTTFSAGRGGQRITVIGDGFTTVQNNATIKTSTGADKLLAANRAYTFLMSNGVWIEVGA